jgi:hypothetical protein
VPGDALGEATLARARAGDDEAFRELTDTEWLAATSTTVEPVRSDSPCALETAQAASPECGRPTPSASLACFDPDQPGRR